MKRLILIIAFIALIPSLSLADTARVYVAEVEGEIKAGTVQYIDRAITEAEREEADYLVIMIDTPGGLVDSTKRIINSMIATEVETVVFVNKSGGWAYSAGSFILMAADHAFSHPDASIGAAEPRVMGESEKDIKMIEAMASWMGSLASGRDSETAKRFVTENLTLSGKDAFSLGVIDGTAENINEVFSLLGIDDPVIVFIQPNFFENVFDVLSHPYLISLFITLGMLGLVFAFRTGEFEISGVLGFIFLAIGLWGIGVINFSVLGGTLLLLGIFLMAAEFFGEPGFGTLGFLGVVSLALGIFNFGAEPFLAPQIFDFITLFTIGVLSSLLILFIMIGRGVAGTFKTAPTTGPESMFGKKGKVTETINPLGRVDVERESWSAKNYDNEKIEKGSMVEIVKIEGNTLIVKPIKK